MFTTFANRSEPWILDISDQDWILKRDETIRISTGDYGIWDQTTGSRIQVFGHISAQANGKAGVLLGSTSSSALVGADAWITGFECGVETSKPGVTLTNDGYVHGDLIGANGSFASVVNAGSLIGDDFGLLLSDGGFVVENRGLIEGNACGANVVGGGEFNNQEGGELTSGNIALLLRGDELTAVRNEGTIRGFVAAITGGPDAPLNLINLGRIVGDLNLGGQNDRIDTRAGTIRGALRGGEGDDLYLISSTDIVIDDTGSSYGDTVRSTADYTLVGGLDHLYLLGKSNVDGIGNVGANNMFGNRGRNSLYGMEGSDRLDGGRGSDVLTGGGDIDTFIFEKGDGYDRITDFDETDLIASDWVRTLKQLNRLDVRQAGDDVLIVFGNGDKLRLEDFDRADLDLANFIPPT
jgi:Ca2+-binding RTX toxin-like protein